MTTRSTYIETYVYLWWYISNIFCFEHFSFRNQIFPNRFHQKYWKHEVTKNKYWSSLKHDYVTSYQISFYLEDNQCRNKMCPKFRLTNKLKKRSSKSFNSDKGLEEVDYCCNKNFGEYILKTLTGTYMYLDILVILTRIGSFLVCFGKPYRELRSSKRVSLRTAHTQHPIWGSNPPRSFLTSQLLH